MMKFSGPLIAVGLLLTTSALAAESKQESLARMNCSQVLNPSHPRYPECMFYARSLLQRWAQQCAQLGIRENDKRFVECIVGVGTAANREDENRQKAIEQQQAQQRVQEQQRQAQVRQQNEALAWQNFSLALQNAAVAMDPARYRSYAPTPIIIPPNYAGTGMVVPGTTRINCAHAGVTCY